MPAKLINDGNGVSGVWESIPFPIPQDGNEVIWNHMLRFQAVSRTANMRENVIYANGSRLDYLRTNVSASKAWAIHSTNPRVKSTKSQSQHDS